MSPHLRLARASSQTHLDVVLFEEYLCQETTWITARSAASVGRSSRDQLEISRETMNNTALNIAHPPAAGTSVERLIAYCRHRSRVCPMPQRWKTLWELLPNRTRSGPVWEPPEPLILGAWHGATGLEKMLRLETHIRWADRFGVLETVAAYLHNLREEEWFHLGD
jgi:hypothetical protein